MRNDNGLEVGDCNSEGESGQIKFVFEGRTIRGWWLDVVLEREL